MQVVFVACCLRCQGFCDALCRLCLLLAVSDARDSVTLYAGCVCCCLRCQGLCDALCRLCLLAVFAVRDSVALYAGCVCCCLRCQGFCDALCRLCLLLADLLHSQPAGVGSENLKVQGLFLSGLKRKWLNCLLKIEMLEQFS